MVLQREPSFAACFSDQIFHSVPSSIRRGNRYFGLSTPGKAEKFKVLSAVVAIFSTPLSLPAFIDMLTDEFHGRRREVPGGAAGLQKW